ncbi:MAG: lactonase family protein, partial [Blastocatellia bacterium]
HPSSFILSMPSNDKTDGTSRRVFCRLAVAGVTGAVLRSTLDEPVISAAARDWLLYVGTYTNNTGSEGIYLCRMNGGTGELKIQRAFGGAKSPAFLAIDAKRQFLYAASEVPDFNGGKTGAAAAYAMDRATGDLKLLNQQAVPGVPCHVSVDRTRKCIVVANYGGGNVAVLPVNPDGSLAPVSDTRQHTGVGPNKARQGEPHAHCAIIDPNNRFAYSADLGLDKVMIYQLDAKAGKLTPHTQPWASVKPGAGPRHFTIHPKGKHAFVINELDATLTVFDYDGAKGTLNAAQAVSTLPEGFTGTSYCADVHVHPSGRFVYGSNRGHNSIAVFAFDAGRLTPLQHQSTMGDWPRNFAVDPAGDFLLVANQRSSDIFVFRIDRVTGRLSDTGHKLAVPAPVCLKLIPAPK